MRLIPAGRCIMSIAASHIRRMAMSSETSCRTVSTPTVQVLSVIAAACSLYERGQI